MPPDLPERFSVGGYEAQFLPRNVVVLGGARTPIGTFLGALKALPAPRLAAAAMAGALQRSGVAPGELGQCVVGQVMTAGQGQSPQRQATLAAGIPPSVDVYRVEKACASGLQAVALAASSIALGQTHLAMAAGVESLSTAPHLLLKARQGGYRLGDGALVDSVVCDGLKDPHLNLHIGVHADAVAARFGLTRAACDEYAVASYKRAADAASQGLVLNHEGLVSMPTDPDAPIPGTAPFAAAQQMQQQQVLGKGRRQQQRPMVLDNDEEVSRLQLDRVASLSPSFARDGVLTSANCFKLGDGAAAIVLAGEDEARKRGLTPIARLLSFADAACEPHEFPLAPEEAMRKALRLAKLPSAELYEIHEAFAVVPLLMMYRMNLCHSKVNPQGGAISLGHPFGMSGVRLLLSLIASLRSRELRFGCAAICHGGGGATAMVVEAL